MFNSLFIREYLPRLQGFGIVQHNIGETYFQPLHNHADFLEILFIVDGEGSLLIDGVQYQIQPQSIVILNPGVWHEEQTYSNSAFYLLCVRISDFQMKGLPLNHFIDSNQAPVISIGERFDFLKQKMFQIEREQKAHLPESEWIYDHMAATLLAEISREINVYSHTRKTVNQHQVVEKVKHYIRLNYQQNITLAALSKIAFLSTFHLSRLFKNMVGKSPIDYLLHYRIEVAKRYLTTTDESIESISQLVGYESRPYFQILFKRVVGLSPSKYRKKT